MAIEMKTQGNPATDAKVFNDVYNELKAARGQHHQMQTAHDGLAVIWEEFEELKTEVFRKHRDQAAMRQEAVQVAAMAIRFVEDICE